MSAYKLTSLVAYEHPESKWYLVLVFDNPANAQSRITTLYGKNGAEPVVTPRHHWVPVASLQAKEMVKSMTHRRLGRGYTLALIPNLGDLEELADCVVKHFSMPFASGLELIDLASGDNQPVVVRTTKKTGRGRVPNCNDWRKRLSL